MAEIPITKEDYLASCSSDETTLLDQSPEKSDSFVIDMDMDAFSSAINKDNTTNNANSRLFTRSHSRKGSLQSQRGSDRKVNGIATLLVDKDTNTVPLLCSPKGPCTPEKAGGAAGGAVMAVTGSVDHFHHQITITAASSNMSGGTESKCIARRSNSFRRPPSSWALDPKRVLLIFATLSSMGTMLLIYFTLTISKENNVDDSTQ